MRFLFYYLNSVYKQLYEEQGVCASTDVLLFFNMKVMASNKVEFNLNAEVFKT